MRLHSEAEHRWQRDCPCCGVKMRFTRAPQGKPTPKSEATRAHDRAVAHGGDASVWLWACRRCNSDQHWLSFAAFARMLILRGDPRADRVAEVARFVSDYVRRKNA